MEMDDISRLAVESLLDEVKRLNWENALLKAAIANGQKVNSEEPVG